MQTKAIINSGQGSGRVGVVSRRMLVVFGVTASITVVFLPLLPIYVSGSFTGDVIHQYIPFKALAGAIWKNGELPLWNPYIFSGAPLLADPQNSLLYPSQVLFLMLPLNIVFGINLYIHVLFLFAGFYFLLRTFCDRSSSLFLALTFALSGPVFVRVAGGIMPTVQALAWVPWIFYFLEMHRRRRTPIWSIAFGISFAMQILGGFPTLSFYTALSIAVYMASVTWENIRQHKVGIALKSITHWFFAILGALCLSAAQMIPTFEFLSLSGRSLPSQAFVKNGSLPPFNLITTFLPEIFGSALTGTAIQGANWMEQNLYIGVMPLILIFTYIFVFRRVFDSEFRLYLLILSLCLFVALGLYNPLYTPFYLYVPFFKTLADPGRMTMLVAFFLVMLSAISLSRLSVRLPELSVNLRSGIFVWIGACAIFLVIALLVLTFGRELLTELAKPIIVQRYGSSADEKIKELPALYNTQMATIMNCLFVLIAGASVVYARMISRISAKSFVIICGIITILDVGMFAIRTVDATVRTTENHSNLEYLSVLRHHQMSSRVLPLNAMAFTNQGSLYQVPAITGYNPLILASYQRLLGVIRGEAVDPADRVPMVTTYDSRLLPLLNVGYVISDHPLNDPQLTLLDSRGAYLYKLPIHPQPARMYYNVEYLPDDGQIASRLADTSFDPMQTLLIKGANASITSAVDSKPVWKVNLIRSSALRTEFDVYTSAPGWLLISDTYYPGWKATVNGRQTTIRQAHLALRAIEIPEGRHTVVFVYDPDSFRFGMFISLVSTLILFGFIGYKGICFLIFCFSQLAELSHFLERRLHRSVIRACQDIRRVSPHHPDRSEDLHDLSSLDGSRCCSG